MRLVYSQILNCIRFLPVNVNHFSTTTVTEPRPFHEIPGPKFLHRAFLPGGECYKKDASTVLNYFRRRYGDIYKIYQFSTGKYLIVTFDPNDFEKIYREGGIWPTRKIFPSIDHYRLQVAPETAGLLNYQGKKWHDLRTILNPIMMQPKVVNLYVPKIDKLTRDFVQIVKGIRDEKNETSAEFQKYINRWVVDSASLMAFNTEIGALTKKDGSKADQFIQAVDESIDLIYQLDILPSIWKYYKTKTFYKCMDAQDRIAKMSFEYLNQAKQKIKDSKENKADHEKGILERILETNENLAKPIIFDILSAGIDTVTSSLKSILYLLAKNKVKQEKLRQEIQKILPEKKTPLTVDATKHLPYLRAVIKESLRIFSPTTGNSRNLKVDTVIQGFRIPKDTQIAFPNTALSRSESHFHRSSEFIPERWLRDDSYLQEGCRHAKETHPFVYMPFGHGSRSCVGKRFAELEIMIFLIRMIREFNVEWHHQDMEMRSTIIDCLVGDAKFRLIETKM